MTTSRLPGLDVLRAFSAFAETRNFSEAARRLHVSQPALHTKINGLGAMLGAALYIRRGPVIELTRQGEELARLAGSLVDRARTGIEAIRHGGGAETVVLAGGAGVFLYLLGPALQAFRKTSPGPLRLTTANEAQTVDAVQKGVADIAVAPLERAVSGIQRHELRRFGQILVMPAEHPFAGRRKVALEDLRDVPLVLPPRGRPHRDRISASLLQAGIDPLVVAEADGWHLMLRFAALQIGLCIVNDYCELPAGMTGVPIADLPKSTLYVFRTTSPRRSEAAELLWNTLVATTGEPA